MSEKLWYAVVTWVAETPTGTGEADLQADEMADTFSTDLERAVGYLNGVQSHSARIQELDTLEDGWWVETRTVKQ